MQRMIFNGYTHFLCISKSHNGYRLSASHTHAKVGLRSVSVPTGRHVAYRSRVVPVSSGGRGFLKNMEELYEPPVGTMNLIARIFPGVCLRVPQELLLSYWCAGRRRCRAERNSGVHTLLLMDSNIDNARSMCGLYDFVQLSEPIRHMSSDFKAFVNMWYFA